MLQNRNYMSPYKKPVWLDPRFDKQINRIRKGKLYQVFASPFDHLEHESVVMTEEAYDKFKQLCGPVDAYMHVAEEISAVGAAKRFDKIYSVVQIQQLYKRGR